jgi:ATP-binding cassette subfamily B multidrug efflux pump
MNRGGSEFGRIIDYLKSYRRLILWGVVSLMVTDVLALIPPWLVKEAIDALPSLSSGRQLLPYLLSIVLVVSGQALFRFGWRNSLFGVSRRVEYHLRNELFLHLQGMDRSFFLRRPVGDLMSRCTNDLVAIQELIAFFGLLVVDSSLTIGTCLILMALIDLPLTLASLAPLPFLSLCFLHFGREVRRKSLEVQTELARLTDVVQETVSGIRLVHSYAMEGVRRGVYGQAVKGYVGKNIDLAKTRGLFWALLGLLTGTAAVIVLWMGGGRVLEGRLSLGGFVAFNTYLAMLSWPMMSLGFMVNLLQRGRASLERIEEILSETPSIVDAAPSSMNAPPSTRYSHTVATTSPTSSTSPRAGGRDPARDLGPSVHFDSVSFRYPASDRWALAEVTLKVHPGARVGITGPVGSGKSTLLEMIPRIHDPTRGSIAVDGRDIRELPLKELRRHIGWVAQEPFLFSDSISDNVRFGAPGEAEDAMIRAVRMARLDKDLDAFPDRWQTLIGERGVMLSGGQRQRVALARALMVAPRLLLLDDAFAHLDAETEAEVMANILSALPRATILFTSHRASSLNKADTVVVLAEGWVIEKGQPEMLAKAGGYFQRISEQEELMAELARLEKRGAR